MINMQIYFYIFFIFITAIATAILAIRKNLNMALFEQREIHLNVLCDEAINNVH